VEWAYTIAGLFVGFLVGLTGVGGGSLMTPLLIFLFGVAPATAVGTDLLFAAITKASGIWAHARRQTIQWSVAGLMALGSIPTAMATILLLGHLHERGIHVETLITSALGVALILTAVAILWKSRMHAFSEALEQSFPAWSRWRRGATIASGVLLGFLVPISSIGAGALGAAMLFLLYPRLPTTRVVGTDLAHAVPLTAVAGLGHAQLGTVDYVLLINLLIGSLPGIYLGSHVGSIIPERIMRPILASMLILIGVKFFFTT